MTRQEQIAALTAAAQHVTDLAKTDPALAERLLAHPAETIGQPLPDGAVLTASRNADGDVELSLEMDVAEGELTEEALAGVAAGVQSGTQRLRLEQR